MKNKVRTMPHYIYSYVRYMELRRIKDTIGLSIKQAAEYDYQRKMFALDTLMSTN